MTKNWLISENYYMWGCPTLVTYTKKFHGAKPYSPSVNGPSYKQPETLFTSLKSVFRGKDHLRFFDHRFIGIWVLPIALTGIVFEILLIAPTNNTSPFN